MSQSILDVRGIGPASVVMLAEKGINSVEDLAAITPMQLSAVKGFNQARSQQVIADAIALLAAEAKQIEPEFARQERVIEDNVDKDVVVEIIPVEVSTAKATDQKADKKSNKKSKKKAKKSAEKSAKKVAKKSSKKTAKKSEQRADKKSSKNKKSAKKTKI